MATTENTPTEVVPSSAPATDSCWKKKNKKEDATFFEGVKDCYEEFKNIPMEQHKTCLINSMNKSVNSIKKIFRMSEKAPEMNTGANPVETSVPLQTTAAK